MTKRDPKSPLDDIIAGGRRLLDEINRLLNPQQHDQPAPVPVPVRPERPRPRYDDPR